MSVRKLVMIFYRLFTVLFVALVVAGAFVGLPFAWWLIWVPEIVAVTLVIALGRRTARAHVAARPPAVEVAAPVTGRWSALNSPASRVPSHRTHAYGQTYAIDIVAEPEPGSRPGFAWAWPVARRSTAFPAFGRPLLAVAEGTVVHASDGRRDHLSRNSLPGLVYLMLIEAAVRDMAGAAWITGNHLIIDIGDGTYAMYAHVRRGSLTVRAGDRVRAGQVVGGCGNSGNSTEPHVHFQLMDHPDMDVARGLPFRWHAIGVPVDGEVFTAGEDTASAPTVAGRPGADPAGADHEGAEQAGAGRTAAGQAAAE